MNIITSVLVRAILKLVTTSDFENCFSNYFIFFLDALFEKKTCYYKNFGWKILYNVCQAMSDFNKNLRHALD